MYCTYLLCYQTTESRQKLHMRIYLFIAGASTYKDVGIGPNQVLSATIEAKPVPSKDLVRITLSPTKILDLPAVLHWHIIYCL